MRSNPIAARLRQVVSQDRNRYKDEETGADMDLSYITSTIIAMGLPASGLEAAWRNHIDDVARFLKTQHPDKFMIWNLSEKEYDYSKFNNQLQDFGFPDHHSPPMDMLFKIILSMDNWLRASQDNVAVVHCLAEHGMQVLTNYGFLSLADVEKHYDPVLHMLLPGSGLLFAAFDEQGGCLRYEPCLQLVLNPSLPQQTMVEFSSEVDNISLLVTPEHDMWVKQPGGGFSKVKAQAFLEQEQQGQSLEFQTVIGNGVEGNASEARSILQGLSRFGGCSNTGRQIFVTASAPCRDQLLQLALHAGFGIEDQSFDESAGQWRVVLNTAGTGQLKSAVKAHRVVGYSGRTWCVTVSTGLIVSRRAIGNHVSCPVIIGNCVGGKGRTGTVIACYLLYCGLFDSPEQALTYFAERRSRISKGVIQPSQLRYVAYFAKILQERKAPVVRDMRICKVVLKGVPNFSKKRAGCKPILKVYNVSQLPKRLLFASGDPRDESLFVEQTLGGITWITDCITKGDVMIKCKHYGTKKKVTIFKTTFHTSFAEAEFTLNMSELDAIPKKGKLRNADAYPKDFSVTIVMDEVPEARSSGTAAVTASAPRPVSRMPIKTTSKETHCKRCLLYVPRDATKCPYCMAPQ